MLFWDTETAKVFAELTPSEKAIEHATERGIQLALSQDGKTLATAGVDGVVKVWQMPLMGEAATFEERFKNIALDANKPVNDRLCEVAQ